MSADSDQRARLNSEDAKVSAGDGLLAPAVTRRVIAEFAKRPVADARLAGLLAPLTDRESEVLRLLARGASNAEIARELVISDATAKTHVSNVLGKLRLRDRVQAVIFAYESGLVAPVRRPRSPRSEQAFRARARERASLSK